MITKIKDKDLIYAITRYDGVRDVICCFTNLLDYAEDLKAQYEQRWIDAGGNMTEVVFNIQANTFYAA